MKTIDEYMSLPYRMEITKDESEGGYVISYPDLPGCLSCGQNMEKTIKNGEDAKRAWFAAAIEQRLEISEPDQIRRKGR